MEIERNANSLRALYGAEVEGGDLREALTHAAERVIEPAPADDIITTYRPVAAECSRFPEICQTIHATL